jgi:hypothetical protein
MSEEKSVNVNVAAPSAGGSSNWKAIVFSFVLLLAFCICYFCLRKVSMPQGQQYDKKREDSIQRSYDQQLSLKDDSLRRLDIRIEQYQLVIDSLRERYKVNLVKIQEVKNKHDEKAKHIDTLSDDGLIRFFTDRYGEKK